MTEHSVRLHESTRRSLCRLAFILLGLLPLAVCAGMSVLTLLPGYARWQAAHWERALSQRVGLTIRVAQSQSLSPLHYRLENIELLHPETLLKVGSIDAMDLQHRSGSWSIRVSSAKFNFQQLAESCRAVHDWYVCRPLGDRQRAVVELDRLTIDCADQSTSVHDIDAELLPEPGKWGLKATFSMSESPDNKLERPVNQLIVVRYHDPDKSATEMQLRAHQNLPLWMIAPGLQIQPADPQSAALQPVLLSGQFSGVLDVRYQSSEANFFLTDAALENLDFGKIGWHPVPPVSGVGSLMLSQAKWDSTGLQWANGRLDLGPGRMDAALFHALAHYLQWDVPRQNPTQSIAFDRMAAGFRIQSGAIQIVGAVADGTLISDSQGTLARRLDPSAMPVSSLIHALAASESSSSLVRKSLVWLPLDDHQRRETAQVLRIKRY